MNIFCVEHVFARQLFHATDFIYDDGVVAQASVGVSSAAPPGNIRQCMDGQADKNKSFYNCALTCEVVYMAAERTSLSTPKKKSVRTVTATEPTAKLPTLRFRTKLTRNTLAKSSWTWLEVPERVSRAFAPWVKSGHVRVDAIFNGTAIQCSLIPSGSGRHILVVNAAMRREAELTVGNTVAVTVTPRVTDDVSVPDDFAKALRREGARATFEKMASSHRWSLVRYVLSARTDATRARYVARAIDHVLGRTSEGDTPAKQRATTGWHCPACGKYFPRVDAEHRCETLSLDVPFAGRPAAVRALFDLLRTRIATQTNVIMAVHHKGVSFIGRRRFLWAVPRRAWLELSFMMTRRVEHPNVRISTMGPTLHSHIVRLRTPSELDDVITTTLLREAIAHGAPGHTDPVATSQVKTNTGWERDVDENYFAGLLDE
jgi:hypothetical protein